MEEEKDAVRENGKTGVMEGRKDERKWDKRRKWKNEKDCGGKTEGKGGEKGRMGRKEGKRGGRKEV